MHLTYTAEGGAMQVDVAVIPAAGRGTRMRPATRAVPKALMPVVDRPAVQWVVQEAAAAGAHHIFVVVDPGVEDLIERHFNNADEGPLPGLADVVVHPVIQEVARGLGDAVRTARHAVEGRSFFCLLVDNMVRPGKDVLSPMAAAADGRSVVCLRELSAEFLERYGVIVPGETLGDGVLEVLGAVEKPGADKAPSKLALTGRYLFTEEVFWALEDTKPGVGGELQLTDAIDKLGRDGVCRGFVSDTDLLDTGVPATYLEAIAVLGTAHPELGARYRAYLRDLATEL